MLKDPEAKCEEWIRAGVERLIVHIEAFETEELLKTFLEKLRGQFGDADHLKIDIGLGVNLETPISQVLPNVSGCDFIHLMSIAELGEQGHPFEEGIFDKIKELRLAYPDVVISVDGGVNAENALRLIEAGVDRLVVGSAIFNTRDPLLALEDLNFEIE